MDDDIEEIDLPIFYETDDSIDESVENIIELSWDRIKDGEGTSRLRKVQLARALRLWLIEGLVVVPEDYMEKVID